MKILVLDNQDAFRRLIMHHVSIPWPDAQVSGFEPGTMGALPDDFSGAGSDLIVVSEQIEPMRVDLLLERAKPIRMFPPVVVIADSIDSIAEWRNCGAAAVVAREGLTHEVLIDALREGLRSRQSLASTNSLFFSEDAGTLAARGYRFVRKLAGSDFSAVYLAQSERELGYKVLKVVRHVPDLSDKADEIFNRFLQEYEVISTLRHPNIVEINDFGVGDDHAYIVMEYFPEGDLRGRIRRGVTVDEALTATRELAAALSAIHGVGILHRDLKPGNVMCRRDGSCALIDFGLAKQLSIAAEITGTGEIFGTPYYMSPEQGHARPVDERSDIYSLGVIFFEMLTGEKPFVADNPMGIIFRHSHDARPSLGEQYRDYQALFERMAAIDPAERFASADELLATLNA
ncbi:MAG: serine/threonine-protein kinase [Pseudomonadota bacterium]